MSTRSAATTPNGPIDAASTCQDAAPAAQPTYPGTNPVALRVVLPPVGAASARSRVRSRAPTSCRFRPRRRSPAPLTPIGGGANRYSVRLGLGSNYTPSNNLKLYGNQKMGIYANATGADTRFYLTRVLPGEAGHTLILNFFDTGDASQAGIDPGAAATRLQRVRRRVRRTADTRAPPGTASGHPGARSSRRRPAARSTV